MNASWISPYFIDWTDIRRGDLVLPAASHTDLHPGREPVTVAYWDPRPNDDSTLQATPNMRGSRDGCCSQRSSAISIPMAATYDASGGVDSCAVGAWPEPSAGGLSSWSLIAPGKGRARELSYIDPLTKQFGIDSVRKRDLTEEIQWHWVDAAPGLPFQVLHPALCELSEIEAEDGTRVLVGGEFADHVCGHWGMGNRLGSRDVPAAASLPSRRTSIWAP